MVCEQHDVIELDGLAAGLGTSFDVERCFAIEHFSEEAAGLALAEARDELANAVLRHEEVGGEGVGANFDEIIPRRGLADEARAIAIGDDVGVLMREREAAAQVVMRVVGDERGAPVNRAFADVPQDAPELHPEPGFENEVHAFNLFAFLSRSQVTWNPSFTSVVKHSYMCPTTEEHILPIIHANDRVEWFFQMCDEIHWDCADKTTGKPLARVIMKAGDMAAMPAYCRHQGYSPKRSMLLVWENGSPALPDMIARGEAPKTPVEF